MKHQKRILYVQYTNPGAYPPLEHSSRILANAGWNARFLGTGSYGSRDLCFPPHANVAVRLWPFQPPGWRQKLHYLLFIAWCLTECIAWRPTVVYCSDSWSTPIGVLVWYLLRMPVVYHEHDAPGPPTSVALRLVSAARRRLARVAVACVIPQRERLRQFEAEFKPRQAICVWNCPRRDEVAAPQNGRAADGLNLFYVGSLNATLLPEDTIRAIAELGDDVHLHVVGYETANSTGYAQRLKRLASDLGVNSQMRFHGQLPRREFFRITSTCDVGLCLNYPESGDFNRRHLFGASNKLFDYLACGLAVVVPNEHEWKLHVADAGYGAVCEGLGVTAIRSVLHELRSRSAELRRMGDLGRQRILADWNYETQFEPVRLLLEQLAA